MSDARQTKVWLKLQEQVLAGRGARLFGEGAFDGDDAGLAAMGAEVALYLGDPGRAVGFAQHVLLVGDRTFHHANAVRQSAAILAHYQRFLVAPGALADEIEGQVFPAAGPRSEFAAKGRHIYDALFESLRSGSVSHRLQVVVRPESDDVSFDRRWELAVSLEEKVLIAAGYGRRSVAAALLREIAVCPQAVASPFLQIEQLALLGAREGAQLAAHDTVCRHFNTWIPNTPTDAAPLSLVLDSSLAPCFSLEDLRELLVTPRGPGRRA